MRRPLKVLFVNHYGVFGGAQRSMLEMINSFPDGSVEPVIVSPKGNAISVFKRGNIEVYPVFGICKFDHTRYSYYRGIRWFVLLREMMYFIPTAWFFLKNKSKFKDIDLVHINEITCLAPLVLAKRILKKPVVLHARAVMNSNNHLFRTKKVNQYFDKYADIILAIDETVGASLLTKKKPIVIHNGLQMDSVLNRTKDQELEHILSTVPKRKLTLGFIGTVSPAKGIIELVEAVRNCVIEGMDINLVIIGNNHVAKNTWVSKMLKKLHLTYNAVSMIDDFITEHTLQNFIHRIGFSTDLITFYKFIDVVAFPSHYNALGRPVFEAAFFNKPAIVAINNPLPDTFVENTTGLSVQVNNPESIYLAIRKLYNNPMLIEEMGKGAYQLAIKNFDIKKNAKKVVDLYNETILNK